MTWWQNRIWYGQPRQAAQRISNLSGVTGVAVAWVSSYLSNRKRFTEIRDILFASLRDWVGYSPRFGLRTAPFYVSPLAKHGEITPVKTARNCTAQSPLPSLHQKLSDFMIVCGSVRDASDWFLTYGTLLNRDKSEVPKGSTMHEGQRVSGRMGTKLMRVPIDLSLLFQVNQAWILNWHDPEIDQMVKKPECNDVIVTWVWKYEL